MEAEIGRVGRVEIAAGEIPLGRGTSQRQPLGPDTACDDAGVGSRFAIWLAGEAILVAKLWLTEEPAGLGKGLGQAPVPLPRRDEIEEVTVFIRR